MISKRLETLHEHVLDRVMQNHKAVFEITAAELSDILWELKQMRADINELKVITKPGYGMPMAN